MIKRARQPTQRSVATTGFTLIELLMAMAVFSFMLMIVTTGFIQVVRIQQAGIATRATQQNARIVLDAVMKDVRPAATAIAIDLGSNDLLCLTHGSETVEYAVDASGNLRAGTLTGLSCPNPAVITGSWRTLNDTGVEVTQFNVTTTPPVTPGLGTVPVTLTVVSRNNLTALNTTATPGFPALTQCQPGPGAQFCAVTTLSSGASLSGGTGS